MFKNRFVVVTPKAATERFDADEARNAAEAFATNAIANNVKLIDNANGQILHLTGPVGVNGFEEAQNRALELLEAA